MKIALDYDKTYTLDPMLWGVLVHVAQKAGHEVRIVTIRDDRFDRTAPIAALEKLIPVIYTRGVAKRWFCAHFVPDFQPDVWIDDKPETIFQNSETTPEDLAAWRTARGEEVPA